MFCNIHLLLEKLAFYGNILKGCAVVAHDFHGDCDCACEKLYPVLNKQNDSLRNAITQKYGKIENRSV